MNNRIDKYLSIKDEFDLEISFSQVVNIIIELINKYEVGDVNEIKQKISEIFTIITKAKLNKLKKENNKQWKN